MIGIQILSVTFILVMLYVVRIHYKKNELPKVEAIVWSSVLIALGIIVTDRTVNPSVPYVRFSTRVGVTVTFQPVPLYVMLYESTTLPVFFTVTVYVAD